MERSSTPGSEGRQPRARSVLIPEYSLEVVGCSTPYSPSGHHSAEAEADRGTSTMRGSPGSSEPTTTTTNNDETLETPSAATEARVHHPPVHPLGCPLLPGQALLLHLLSPLTSGQLILTHSTILRKVAPRHLRRLVSWLREKAKGQPVQAPLCHPLR